MFLIFEQAHVTLFLDVILVILVLIACISMLLLLLLSSSRGRLLPDSVCTYNRKLFNKCFILCILEVIGIQVQAPPMIKNICFVSLI